MADQNRLLTGEFLAINGIIFLTFCNIAVFFSFQQYLAGLGIDDHWAGTLIALFSLTGLVLRPIISPFFNPTNAKKWIAAGTICVVITLLMYNLAEGIWGLALVRILHGAAYVLLATAVVAKFVGCIPTGRSGQAFGVMAVITLLPYAVVPPVLGPLSVHAGGFVQLLDWSALLMVFSLIALRWLDHGERVSPGLQSTGLRWREIADNLKDRRVLVLLFLPLVLWTTFSPVFFFMQSFGEQLGVPNPGWFFTFSTVTEMAVRVIAGPLLDKYDKAKLLAASLAWLVLGYVALVHVKSAEALFGMGFLLGIGWGVAMPLVSGLMFDISQPQHRALNTNLSTQMAQAGLFVGPIVGGTLIFHWGFAALYYACGGLLLIGLAAVMLGRLNVEARS
ncbi:MAG: MFS transporter [Thermodesulfobacteriota bacterium]